MLKNTFGNLLKASNISIKISPAMLHILKANALEEYKHYADALTEAKKARDVEGATTTEIELAKGKIASILGEMKLEKGPNHKP